MTLQGGFPPDHLVLIAPKGGPAHAFFQPAVASVRRVTCVAIVPERNNGDGGMIVRKEPSTLFDLIDKTIHITVLNFYLYLPPGRKEKGKGLGGGIY